MEKKKKNKIGWIILLLFLLYCSAIGNYLNSGNDYLYDNASWLALMDLGLCTCVMMIVPFIWRIINGKKFSLKKGKNICKWNSSILFIISMILMASINISFIGGLGAVMYYFINKWLFVDEGDSEENQKPVPVKGTFKCSNCGTICYDEDKYCKNCKAVFEEDEEEIKEYRCDNCGYEFNRNFSKCPNCKLPFDDELNSKTNIVAEDVKETNEGNDNEKQNNKQFKCDNCGALVGESDKKCPNCGESFEDEDEDEKLDNSKTDMDQKYSDLKKLKKLLDDEIITKEEFKKEKKKILD